ncbi:MAG: hypothetical protein M3347_05020 [Armatimonadota bacterium]|nr:hypothetical protein [Armatimonadota bacterium]
MDEEALRTILIGVGIVAGLALLLAIVALALVDRQLRRLKIPANAGLSETLRAVPFRLVMGLDLLDLSLDFLAAPIAWIILSRYKLEGLRQVATIEALIPGTQFIPTLTLAWLFVNYTGLDLPLDSPPSLHKGRVIDVEPSPPSGPGTRA